MEHKQQQPPWRSSEGRLREQTPEKTRDGRPHLTGYRSEETQAPREAARLGGAYGDVAIGVSRKKELTVVVSKRRNKNGPSARGEERELQADSAVRVNQARADFRTNSSRKSGSALSYRESRQKPPTYLMERFRELMDTHEQAALREQLPFLDRETDREELRQLTDQADRLRSKGLDPRAEEERKQELRQELTEKTAQENRLRLSLRKAREEARRMAGEADTVRVWLRPETTETAPDPDASPQAVEPGEEPEDADNEQEKHENA